jgi:hypothetical protein
MILKFNISNTHTHTHTISATTANARHAEAPLSLDGKLESGHAWELPRKGPSTGPYKGTKKMKQTEKIRKNSL